MDPFGDDTAAETDLSNFQPPADNAAYNGECVPAFLMLWIALGASISSGEV